MRSSLKEPGWTAENRQMTATSPRIIPGDWGKAESSWLAQPLLSRTARFGGGGRIHQFLWRCSRIVSKREKGTVWLGTMRNRSEPGQVAQASFDSARIAVTQRVNGCYCASARADSSGGYRKENCHQEKRRKAEQNERLHREGHRVSAGPVKTLQDASDVKNDTAGL